MNQNCAAVSFGLESANVVGYQETTLKNTYGYSFIAPTFVDVGAQTASYDLQNIKLTGANVGDGASDYIEIWDDAGAMTDEAYFYVTKDQGYEKDGWVTEMMGDEYVEDVTYLPGQAFFLYIGSGEDVKVQLPAVIVD